MAVILSCHSQLCVSPLIDGVLYGPMHSKVGVEAFKQAVKDAQASGGKVEFGGKVCISRLFSYVSHGQ